MQSMKNSCLIEVDKGFLGIDNVCGGVHNNDTTDTLLLLKH